MRLLNTHTGAFEWHHDPTTVRYAILSHVWDAEGEQSFKDVLRILKQLQRSPPNADPAAAPATLLSLVSAKIRDCCIYARENGYRLVWIDSCCIDKSSSAELSEAINSMYQWYEQSTVCYAFLYDVPSDEDPRAPKSQFRRSRWFTRGWTLQELVTPLRVVFLSRNWRPLGTLSSLATVIEEVTGIDRGVLLHQTPLRTISVARRMSWAATRVTTRVEDEAYSLMGLFGVMMPTIYGEGRYAFARLQEEILKQAPDQTIFAWGPALRPSAHPSGIQPAREYFTLDNVLPRERNLFASSPHDFAASADVEPESHLSLAERLGGLSVPFPEYTSTGYGDRTRIPLLPPLEGAGNSIHIGVLSCVGGDGNLIGLFFHADRTWMTSGYYIGMTLDDSSDTVYRTVPLTDDVRAQWGPPEVAEVYLPTRVVTSSPWTQAPSSDKSPNPFAMYDIILPDWRKRELEEGGVAVRRVVEPSHAPTETPPTHRFLLTKGNDSTICIEFDSCICDPGLGESPHGRMRAVVEFRDGNDSHSSQTSTPRSDLTNGTETQVVVRGGHTTCRAVVHDVAHPDHVNSHTWLLDDESCTAASKDFFRYAEGEQHPVEAVRLTLSPSPEQWADSAPRTWDNVYTLDIDIFDPNDEDRGPAYLSPEIIESENRLLLTDRDWNVHSNLWGYDPTKGKFVMARRARLRRIPDSST